MPSFVCQTCGSNFDVPDRAIEKYPGWTPKACLKCRPGAGRKKEPAKAPPSASKRKGGASREENLTCAEVLAKYVEGPKTGVFTDGAADPNPGPGGWGCVYVVQDEVVAELCGHEPHTTNNRMELAALIHGVQLVPQGQSATIYTDSQLCVNTITKWAKGWEKRGWKRKEGEVKNVELVKELFYALSARPELRLEWIAAHSGFRWNEYSDALATAYRRGSR